MIWQLDLRHRSAELRKFLDTIDAAVAKALDVHIILVNYATHKTALIQRWLARRPRFHLHFTPTGASWLNLLERWFALLTEKQIKRGAHPTHPDARKRDQGVHRADEHGAQALRLDQDS